MRRLVRKSSDEGRAAERSTSGSSGLGGRPAFLFLLNVFDLDETVGRGGTSESCEGLRVDSALSLYFFLDRKRFIVARCGRWYKARDETLSCLYFEIDSELLTIG